MQTIRILLSSDKELNQERMELCDIVESLNTILSKHDINILMLAWDSDYNHNEYAEKLSTSDLYLNLYYETINEMDLENLDTAYKSFCDRKNPKKIYLYFKDSENVSEKLREFRDSLPSKYGHFHCSFSNVDALRADFLLQFEEYKSKLLSDYGLFNIKEGRIFIDGQEYVDLQKVPFVGNCEEYNELTDSIAELNEWIEEHDGNHPKYKEKQEKLVEKEARRAKMEQDLWNTALHVTKLLTNRELVQQTEQSKRLQRAIRLLHEGEYKACNELLIEADIDKDVELNNAKIDVGESGKIGLRIDIESYATKAQTIISTGQYSKENEESIVRLYDKVLVNCCKINDDSIFGEKLNNYVEYLRAIKRYAKGIEIIDNAISHIKDRIVYLNLIYTKGYLLMENSDIDGSIWCFEYVLPEYRILYNKQELTQIINFPKLLSDLGSIYINKALFKDSIDLLKESLEEFKNIGKENDYSCIFTALKLSEAYINENEFEKATSLLEETETNINRYLIGNSRLFLYLYRLKIVVYNHYLHAEDNIVDKTDILHKMQLSTNAATEIIHDTIDLGKGKADAKVLNPVLDFTIKTVPLIEGNAIECDIPALFRKATACLNGLYEIGAKEQSHNMGCLLDVVKISYNISRGDYKEAKLIANLAMFGLPNGDVISNEEELLINCLLATSLINEINFRREKIGKVINERTFKDELTKSVYQFKYKIIQFLAQANNEDAVVQLRTLYSEYCDKFSSSIEFFKDNFAGIMSEFINTCVYNILIPEENYDSSLAFIEQALQLDECFSENYYNLIDTKAEVLCRLNRVEEALSLAKQVYQMNPQFYPENNEYLYESLMRFQEWKQLFKKS